MKQTKTSLLRLVSVMVLIIASAFVSNAQSQETIHVEAEDYVNMFGIQTEGCSEGGLNVGWIEAGDWMDYTITVANAGTFTVDIRVAGLITNLKTAQIRTASGNTDIQFNGTGGWQSWTTASGQVQLSAGTQIIRVYSLTAGWNINWIEFTSGEPGVSVTGVSVSPTTVSVDEGSTAQLSASVSPSNATNQSVSWSSDDEAIATVNSSGLVTSVSAGTANITVTTADGGFTATSVVTFNPDEGNGGSCTITEPEFSVEMNSVSSNPTITFIPNVPVGSYVIMFYKVNDNTGIFPGYGMTAQGDGIFTRNINASSGSVIYFYFVYSYASGGQSPSTEMYNFTVGNCSSSVVAVTGVSVSPTTVSVDEGSATQFTASVIPSDATNQNISWSSDNEAAATVDANGIVTGVAAGIATITVTTEDGSYTATCDVTVNPVPPVLTSIVVSPVSISLEIGGTQQFTAIGYDQYSNVISISPTWSANAPNGTFTATTAGTYTVTATQDGIVGSATVTVNPEPSVLTSIVISPASVTLQIGESQQFTATGYDQYSNVMSITPTWSANAPAGLFVETTAGTYTVTATQGTISGSATVTVVDEPVSIHIEAEDYTNMNGVQTQATTDVGGGINVGWIDAGDWMEYSVNIPVTGAYTFTARVASVPGGGTLEIQENGSTVGSISIAATGGWQVWTSLSTTVMLTQGTQTIRLYAPTGGYNVNWFELSTDVQGPLSIPLHIEYAQYLRLGFSPADLTGLDELITQNTTRETTLSYDVGTTFTISLIEKRREEEVRFYTFNNGNVLDTIQGVPLTVTAYPGMEIFIDFIEVGGGLTDPIAVAGDNQVIDIVSGTCYTLNGSTSFDPDGGNIAAYSWAQISGPNTASMSNANGAINEVCNLVVGTYVFELTVTDDEGATGTDQITLTMIQENADFALQSPAYGTLITENRRPQFTWESVAGATRYEVYVNVTKDNYNWYASGNLLDRYTKVGESTINSFTMPYDLVDRWTYKWYVLAITNGGTLTSNKMQFGVYIPYLEQEPDAISTAGGYRDMNKNGTMEPFENWRLTPEERLNDLMARLPLEEKFKQSYYGGGSDPKSGFGFSYGVEHIMKDEQYDCAATTWGIPMAHAGDKIHGWKTIYPTQLGLAATRDPNIAYQCGNMQRVEHKAFGFAGTLTPLAEVDTKVLYPRFQEGNGENADEAAAIIRALVCGMQGGPEVNPHSMLITVKHWPGQGAGGEGPTQYDARTIGYHMKPWYATVEANAASVMPGYSSSPFIDPTGAGSNSSKPIIDYLRDVVGFEGFIVTDWLASNTSQSIESMSAGIDVLGGASASGTDVNQLVAAIGIDRLNEACRRVLNQKIRMGMFENPYADPTASWTNAEHHDIALNAARKSITVIKNNGVLPLNLNSGSTIGVAGPRATWPNRDSDPNVIWQSIYYDNPQAMNYVDAFANRASANGINVIGGQGTNPNVAVVVIGEEGYTHGTDWADKDPDIPTDQLNAIRDFSNRGIPVITVVISPRPYVLTEVVNLSAAVMLVYRGGNGIAQATAELCFGDYNPSGKLPFQLPRSQDQIGTDNLNNQIEHWELPYDIGATAAERAEIINLMENDLPISPIYGDPLFQYGEGIDNIYTIKGAEEDVRNIIVNELSIFPNPASNIVYIKFYSETDARVDLYSVSGNLMKTTNIAAETEVTGIDVSGLEAGYYFIKVSNGGDTSVSQFIKR